MNGTDVRFRMLHAYKSMCDAFWEKIIRNLGINKSDFIGPYSLVIFFVCAYVYPCAYYLYLYVSQIIVFMTLSVY